MSAPSHAVVPGRRPRARLAGRGYMTLSEGGPGTPRHKRALLTAASPGLLPLSSLAGFDVAERRLALTYDDGPNPDWTPGVLDALAAAEAKATFFMLVERAEAHPELARRVLAEGHEVGLHGIDHSRLTTMPPSVARQRTIEGKARLEDLLGAPVRYFRPPYGAQTKRSFLAARQAGMDVVAWSAWGRDWEEQAPEQIVDRVLHGVSPGGIVLLHDSFEPEEGGSSSAPTFDPGVVATLLLQGLQERGAAVVPLRELQETAPSVRVLWFS